MVCFTSDYTAGAHPEVMRLLNETNLLHTSGYGVDEFTAHAREMILKECGIPEGMVYFLVGGTQTNTVVIDRLLERNDGVLSADSGHINVHEAGAIELTGHKVLTLPTVDGKINSHDIREYISTFYSDETHAHMVRPAMVYISFPTELGTLYSLKELQEISDVCREVGIPIYVDGARMAYGLSGKGNDVTLKDIAALCDVFYIGGTKCGALFGEAVVTRRPELLPRFQSLVKMHGGLLAKGRLLGLQFEALFTDGLYYRLGKEAVRLALKLKQGIKEKGYRLFIDSPTNQQFALLPNNVLEKLAKVAAFEYWGAAGKQESHVRFVTDWTTTDHDIDILLDAL